MSAKNQGGSSQGEFETALCRISRSLRELGNDAERLAAECRFSDPIRSPDRLSRARRLQKALDARNKAFGVNASMFGDPAFEILLLAYIHALEQRPLYVKAVTMAGNTKSTTGIRWMRILIDKDLIVRFADDQDGRRSFVELSEEGRAVMDRYIDMVDL